MLLFQGCELQSSGMNKIVGYISAFFVCMLTAACSETSSVQPLEGRWHAVLKVMDDRELPFTFAMEKRDSSYAMQIFNAGELIEVDEIRLVSDSIYIRFPVFEEYIAAKVNDTLIRGSLINESRERKVPFVARYGKRRRFPAPVPPGTDVSGKWQVTFSPDSDEHYPALGIFFQENGNVRGTFRTATGDRRFLEGVVSGDSMKISTFDGTHAYLFVAKVSDSMMQGVYYSGNHFKEPFEGRRNPEYELADEYSITFLKEGYDRFGFTFQDTEGNRVSLSDPRFQGKVVIVQLMGSWCPNCLDETRFLVDYASKNGHKDLELVALAFEYAKTEEKALSSIKRLRERVGVTYPMLLAQFGGADKLEASHKLPMLNRVISYPTTIFIDREGSVRRIHTGFNGPATGEKYMEFQREFDSLVQKLLSE
jgi:thiol-disulfide isomerase/thioredoxin